MRIYSALFSLLFLVSCSSGQVTLNSQYVAPGSTHQWQARDSEKSLSKRCSVDVRDIEDVRTEKSVLSTSSLTSVKGENMPGWFSSAVKTLQSPESARDDADVHLFLDAKLKKAYIAQISTSHSVNLVAEVVLQRLDSALAKPHIVRATYTDINWMNSESEINESFSYAMRDLLAKIEGIVEKSCN